APQVPPEAERLTNPLAGDPAGLPAGKQAYDINCAMCHGSPGRAIGPVGESYLPRPPDLARQVPQRSAGHLYCDITEGIRSTPTPEAARYLPREWHAFREITTPKERWAIVAYM